MPKLLIFDCDGTLVDTLHDVALCFNQALEENGFPAHPIDAFGSYVGGNLEQIVARLLPQDAVTSENVDKVKASYRALYGASEKPHTVPYEGIRESLEAFKGRGYAIAVNTNKGQALADDLLLKLFPDSLFDAIVGYEESRPSKPDPYGVEMICSKLGCDLADAIYIGDGESDLLTAKNAGIPFVLVEWGQGEAALRDSSDVSCIVGNPAELVGIIEKLLIGA